MSTQVTVTLPDETYRRAETLARLSGRDIAEILADTIDMSLQPLGTAGGAVSPIAELSDADVLALSEAQMDEDQDRRLSALLVQQQAGSLSDDDRRALLALLQVYQEGLLRKAQALREAVTRGLRPSLEP